MEIQFLFAALASAMALLFAFAYLSWRTGERYLGPWVVVAGLWIIRYGSEIATLLMGLPFPSWLNSTLALSRGVFMFLGARWLARRGFPAWAWPVVVVSTAWAFVAPPPTVQPWGMLVPLGVLCAGFTYAGHILLGTTSLPTVERQVTGWAMILIGIIHLLYPLSFVTPWIQPFGFASAAALQLVVAVGILLAYFRASVEEAMRVSRRQEMALTRVLSDFVSICAHCKDVRAEEDRWVAVEGYVANRTEASVNAAHCPECSGA